MALIFDKTELEGRIQQLPAINHNGSLKTLIEVVQFYNRGGRPNSSLDKVMAGGCICNELRIVGFDSHSVTAYDASSSLFIQRG